MKRATIIGAWAIALSVLLGGATLEKLSLAEMSQKATAVVRGRVTGSYTSTNGSLIYTHYRVSVAERWKGEGTNELDLVVPGGAAGGLRQSFSGAPKLEADRDYVLFLWTGRSGLTHIIGLSQGIFDVAQGTNGETVASRPATGEVMLDSAGRPVRDEAMRFRLSDLRGRVGRAVAEGGRK